MAGESARDLSGLKNWSSASTDWRSIGDEPVDELVKQLETDGVSFEKIARALNTIERNNQRIPDDLPKEVQGDLPPGLIDFFQSTAAFPDDFADHHKVRMAEHMFTEHGSLAFIALACSSLPECYADKLGAPVLSATGQLIDRVQARVVETAQILIAVMAPGGMDPNSNGSGILMAQKVRLRHAWMRHWLEQDPSPDRGNAPPTNLREAFLNLDWRSQFAHLFGKPINQEDMAFTLLTFSWVILRSLRRIGVSEAELSEEVMDAYVHAWNVVGLILGVDKSLMAAGARDAEQMFTAVANKVQGRSADGVALTAALLQFLEDSIPAWLAAFRRTPAVLMRDLIGDDTADMLEVPVPNMFEKSGIKLGLRSLQAVENLVEEAHSVMPVSRAASTFLSRHFLEQLYGKSRLGAGVFTVPPELRKSWKFRHNE